MCLTALSRCVGQLGLGPGVPANVLLLWLRWLGLITPTVLATLSGFSQAALDIRGPDFADKLFKAIDTRNTGSVSTEQLISCLLALEAGTLEERVAFTFSIISGSTEHPYVSFQQLKDILQV